MNIHTRHTAGQFYLLINDHNILVVTPPQLMSDRSIVVVFTSSIFSKYPNVTSGLSTMVLLSILRSSITKLQLTRDNQYKVELLDILTVGLSSHWLVFRIEFLSN